MFVEFSLYNINTNLLAVFSFLFEFPVSERAQSSLDLLVITLWPITGLDLQLLLTVTPDNPSVTANNYYNNKCIYYLPLSCNPILHPNIIVLTHLQRNFVPCFPDRPNHPGVVFPGAGDLGLPQRGLQVPALSLESPGHLQTDSGGICVWAAPEPLHHGQAAVGLIHEAPTGRLHRFLPPGQAESNVHSHVCFAAVHTGAKGKRGRQRGSRADYKHIKG